MTTPSFARFFGRATAPALLLFLTLSTNSCSSGTSPNSNGGIDTLHLVSSPNNIMFQGYDTNFAVVKTELTGGGDFALHTLQTGGDISAFVYETSNDAAITTPHVIEILVNNQDPPHHLYQAWMAFSAVNSFGKTDYDTLRFSANIP